VRLIPITPLRSSGSGTVNQLTKSLPFPIHAHMLRHAAGYALAARGVDTRTLQAFMGHRSIANTVVYTSVADKRIRNIWGK
jgi:type 1 fimbriae regulatory protein FimB/type 1 fimbriae regulatory protein FimE